MILFTSKLCRLIFTAAFLVMYSQNTVVEFEVSRMYAGSKGKEVLIFNTTDAYYFDYVEGDSASLKTILQNYRFVRGGQKMYRKLDNFNRVFRLKTYPDSGYTHFIINDVKPPINWKIHPQVKKILGFDCQKASATFRGRTYNVWFTKDIPTALGPWKLDGLPGLILEASDGDGIYKYEAVNVLQNSNLEIPAVVYGFMEKYDQTKIRNYRDFIKHENDGLSSRQEQGIANLPKGVVVRDIPSIRDLEREKSFEWEAISKKP